MKTFALLGLLLISAPVLADDITGQASVIDGDTIEIQGKRVRLFGIDALENAQTCTDRARKPYRCGQNAANALAEFIRAKTVRCEPQDTDRYGRTVAICRAGSDDIAEWLVRSGLALDYLKYSKGAYAAAQAAADGKDAGMWQGPFIEPWLYRACVRTGGRQEACSTGGL